MAIGDFFKDNTSEGNAKRREMIGSLGRDALRQMNPFRDSTPAPQPQPTGQQSVSMNENAQPGSAARTARQNPALNVMPAPSHAPVRMSTLAGSPQSPTSFSGNENARPQSLAATGLASPPPATQRFRTTLAGGINYTGDNQGNRTYTMGTPGQDEYGRVSVRPGSASGQVARNALAANVPQAGQQTRQVGGLTVAGSQDAVSRLAAPVGTYDRNSPEYNQAQAQGYQKANPFSQNNPYDDRLSYRPPQGYDSPLVAPPPVAMGGGGWKSQVEADKTNAAAYGDYVRSLSTLQSSAAQERGANYRAGLQQQGVNDRNAIDRDQNDISRQRLRGDLALNDARIASEGVNQQKGQMEVDSLRKAQELRDAWIKNPTPENEAAYRGAIGKFEKEAQFGTVGKYDDQGMKIGEDVYNKQTGERKDASQQKYEDAPIEASGRKKGSIYNTPKGPLMWNGSAWQDVI